MPTVPRYGGRKVATAALPGVRKSAAETPQSLGAGVAQAKGQTAETLANAFGAFSQHLTGQAAEIAAAQRERADDVALLAAGNALDMAENKYLYGDGTDANPGALNRRGKDALGLPEETLDTFDEWTNDAGAQLQTDRQRLAFQKLALNKRANLDLTVRRHVDQQITQFEADELKSKIDLGTNAAIANAMDPHRSEAELADVVAALKIHGPRMGMGPDALENQIATVTSNVRVGVIDRLLANDNPGAAKVYFEELKGDIQGEALARVEKAIDAGNLRKQGQQKADAILAAGGTLTEQREKARAIEDPQLRDEVTQRLEHEAVVKDAADRDAHEARLTSVYDVLDRTKDVSRIPPATWAEMSGGERSAARNYAENLARGVGIKTDLRQFYGLMDLAGLKPEEFAQTNLLQYRGVLDEGDFKQLVGLQLSLRKGNTKETEQELAGFRTRSDIWNDMLNVTKIDPKTPAAATLRRELDFRVEQLQRDTGKKASNVEIQEIGDNLVQSVVLQQGSWWSILPGGAPFSDVTKKITDLTYDDIPGPDRKRVEDMLRASGRPVTEDSVLTTYVAAKRRIGQTRY